MKVIVLDGDRRNTEDASSRSPRVLARELDTSEWHVRHYGEADGSFILARGSAELRYADQFDLFRAGDAARLSRTASHLVRSTEVRRTVLRRATGACELCFSPGFETTDGRAYLETHHVVALCDGGADHPHNVIALCPDHHRRAHFGVEKDAIRDQLLTRLAGIYSAGR